MLHIRPEAADAGLDRFAVFRMPADFARQRQQLHRKLELHVVRRGAFRNAGTLRLLAFLVVLRFTQLDIRPEAS